MSVSNRFRRFAAKRHLTRGFEQLEFRRLLHAGAHGADDPPADVSIAADAAVDFSLADLNPASGTYSQPVSPRDYLGQISVWMFGYST